jgi:DnaK suppressor protein
MDAIDNAANLEQFDRDRALTEQRNRGAEPPQHIEAGQVLCIDCDTPIGLKRLAAKPTAARCIDCQQLFEYREAHGCNG